MDVVRPGTPPLLIDTSEEVGLHGGGEAALPVGGSGYAVLVGVLIHVERDQVGAVDLQVIDDARGNGVLWYGSHWENQYALAPLVGRLLDALDHVHRERRVELGLGVDDVDLEVPIRPGRRLGDLLFGDRPNAGALLRVLEVDELCERWHECHVAPPFSTTTSQR